MRSPTKSHRMHTTNPSSCVHSPWCSMRGGVDMEKEAGAGAGAGDWAPLSSAPPRGLLGSTSGADNRARRALLGDSLA